MDGKISVVTGATSGLGLVTATELARLGSRVVLLVRDRERGRAVSNEIAETTGSSDVTVVAGIWETLMPSGVRRQHCATFRASMCSSTMPEP
jgi:NAD(P)-dependent dehydrogenase (short-subunit alcohol dehydrogenase family)